MSVSSGFSPIQKGEVVDSARVNPSMYGAQVVVKNMQVAGTTDPTDGRETVCRIVKNDSGGVITPGTPVKLKISGGGYKVAGECGAEVADGVSDPHFGAAECTDGKWFLMVVSGPTKIQKAAGTITFRDNLHCIANGQVDHFTAATPTVVELANRIGVAEETSSAAANTLIKCDVRHLV